MPDRLVYYSLTLPPGEVRPDLVWQLAASVRTLRAHNTEVPIVLFVHGGASELAEVCARHGVALVEQGPYERRLAELCPAGWQALARYPLLHKFLNFGVLAELDCAQVLYCDCDTIFFDDVERLFDRYARADLAAREEALSRRSPFGYDPGFVDEELLARIAAHEGLEFVPPFNLGVVLFGNGVASRLAGLEPLFVSYAWRLATWMGRHPAVGAAAAYGEFAGAADARALAGAEDRARALPFPSHNRWILDEVALWLSLGAVPGLRSADFHPADVAQNGEFAASDPVAAGWVLCHYYSQNMGRIEAWLRRSEATAAA